MHRLFLDANIFFAATASATGASRAIFLLAQKKYHCIVSSAYAIEEARRNIALKLPEDTSGIFWSLVSQLHAVDNQQPSQQELQRYHHILPTKDIPIIVSAMRMHADFLITLDKKDFKSKKMGGQEILTIKLPGEYLQELSDRPQT